jgi:hypothetical protein
MAIEFSHQVDAVSFRGFYADAQYGGNFLAALALGKKLYDFALARSERRVRVGRTLRAFGLAHVAIENNLRDLGG